jgi:hypothetical protein
MSEDVDKLDWYRVGDTISGGRIVVCELKKGAFGLYDTITIYSKKSTKIPVPSRIVLVEKCIDFNGAIEEARHEIMTAVLNDGNRRLDERLKAIDNYKKTIHPLFLLRKLLTKIKFIK